MAETALALGAFEAAEGYEADGATSTTAWAEGALSVGQVEAARTSDQP